MALAAVVAGALTLAACGGDSGLEGGITEGPGTVPAGEAGEELTISQWPLYVDPGPDGTVAEFERESGIDVKWSEEINDNVQFFGKIQPQLARGESGGRDMLVISDWLARKMYELGYLYEFDDSGIPNARQNLIPSLRDPAADPERAFTIPWQSGMTGLIVRTDLAPDVDEVADLFDPKYAGKVTLLAELRDTVPMVMKSMGVDPDEAETDDWLAAIDKLDEAADSGQIRKFTGNDYIRDLSSGDAAVALGWSGDAIQLQADNPNIEFVMPKEGCMLWSTSMVIPEGADNPQGAQEFIDFVYDPEVQADIAEWVNYVTPVSGVREILADRDPGLARDPLIFPSEEYTAECTYEPVLGGKEGREIEQAFQQVIAG